MKISQELYRQIKGAHHSMLDDNGREIPDPTPMEMTAGMTRPVSLQEQIQRLVKTELSRQAVAQNYESFAEANDFEIQDVFDVEEPITKYQQMEEEFLEVPESSVEGEAKPAAGINEADSVDPPASDPVEED